MRYTMTMGLACLLWVAGCGDTTRVLDTILLEPDPQLSLTPSDLGFDYQEVNVPVAEGRSVMVWHVATTQPKAVIVVLPGAADNRSLYTRLALPLIGDAGYDILLMDYEGYGNSPGEARLRHTLDDAVAVTAYAKGLHEKVVLYGISLGVPLAARAATKYDVAAVVLDGNLVVDDALNLWADGLPFVQAELLRTFGPMLLDAQLPEGFDTLKYIAKASGAKLVIHSPFDNLTPFASGLEVYAAAAPPKTFWQGYDDHGRMIRVEPNVYADTLLSWLDATITE